jgi:uncharacterized protein
MQVLHITMVAAVACVCTLAAPAADPSRPRLNRLAAEDSTYLRSLAGSAVDWHPWGPEAFAEAERTGRPLCVSIGYASCLWSSRVDRETFEDPTVAARLNDGCVNVKIDRFERPDLDRLYQRYVEATGQRAGWPLILWLTADRRPLRAAASLTAADVGEGSFTLEVGQMLKNWSADAPHLRARARVELDDLAARTGPALVGPLELDEGLATAAQSQILGQFDPVHGGFGEAPKFPSPARLAFLATRAARLPDGADGGSELWNVLRTTLDSLARSSLRDHLGGGFFRYALDEAWRRPYFEKLALDQALHADTYLLGHRLTGDARYAELARQTLEYTVRELGHPGGGFYTGEHCESPSPTGAWAEGAHYVWSESELRRSAGSSAEVMIHVFDIRERGNLPPGADAFQGLANVNVLAEARSSADIAARLGLHVAEIQSAFSRGRASLLAARNQRPRPALDRLIITQMNAALVSSLARAGVQLGEPAFLDRARRAADFILSELWDESQATLYRCRLDRAPRHLAVAEDHAFLVRALLDLHEATGEIRWLRHARDVQAAFDRHHADSTGGGYFDARHGCPDVPVALKSIDDAAGLSPNAVAGQNLVRWAGLLRSPTHADQALRLLHAFALPLRNGSGSVAGLTQVADSLVHPPRRIILLGPATAPEARSARALIAATPPGRWQVLTVENDAARRWLAEAGALPASVADHPLDRSDFFLDDTPESKKDSQPMHELHKILGAIR